MQREKLKVQSEKRVSATSSKPKPDIQGRTYQFAVRVLKVVASLPNNTIGFVVGKQLARSGTSVGANVQEAQGAPSKAEFTRRMNIARSEALETRYWLNLAVDSELVRPERLTELLDEVDEIIRILVAIVKTARRSDRP